MEFETEEQQVEAIKKWFKEYGATIIAGLVLGTIGIFGFRYYSDQLELSMAEKSDAYEAIMVELKKDDNNQVFIAKAATFNKANSDSVYSNLLSLQLAKLAVTEQNLGTAAQHLTDALNDAQHGTIEHIARVRLCRVLIAQKEFDKALALIGNVVGDEFSSSYEMLRGDIWFAKGNRSKAQQAYAKAKLKGSDGPVAPSLEMLLTELAEESAEAKAE